MDLPARAQPECGSGTPLLTAIFFIQVEFRVLVNRYLKSTNVCSIQIACLINVPFNTGVTVLLYDTILYFHTLLRFQASEVFVFCSSLRLSEKVSWK